MLFKGITALLGFMQTYDLSSLKNPVATLPTPKICDVNLNDRKWLERLIRKGFEQVILVLHIHTYSTLLSMVWMVRKKYFELEYTVAGSCKTQIVCNSYQINNQQIHS